MFDPNTPDDASDLDFMRTLLRACLESLDDSDEDSFLNHPDPSYDLKELPEGFNTPVQNARRRIRRLVFEGLAKDGEPSLTLEALKEQALFGSCLTCVQCQLNYNNPSSPAYHNYATYLICLRCPCI